MSRPQVPHQLTITVGRTGRGGRCRKLRWPAGHKQSFCARPPDFCDRVHRPSLLEAGGELPEQPALAWEPPCSYWRA
jgi:hypothetical protein